MKSVDMTRITQAAEQFARVVQETRSQIEHQLNEVQKLQEQMEVLEKTDWNQPVPRIATIPRDKLRIGASQKESDQ